MAAHRKAVPHPYSMRLAHLEFSLTATVHCVSLQAQVYAVKSFHLAKHETVHRNLTSHVVVSCGNTLGNWTKATFADGPLAAAFLAPDSGADNG